MSGHTDIHDVSLPDILDDDLYRHGGSVVWHRIVDAASSHVTRFNELRTWGPASNSRYDPWIDHPPIEHADGVTYLGDSLETALLEKAYHDDYHLSLDRQPMLYRIAVDVESLKILDLRSGWSDRIGYRNGDIMRLGYADSRVLAYRIRNRWDDLAGLAYRSIRNGRGTCLVLWGPSRTALAPATLVGEEIDLSAGPHMMQMYRIAAAHNISIAPRGL